MKPLCHAFALLLLIGCGLNGCGAEEAAPETEPAEEEEVEALPPPPEPEPAPEPIPECPEDTWAVGANGTNEAAADGPAAANLVRDATRGPWTRVSICRTVDGEELHMICGPSESGGGAECSLGMPGRRCSTTMPGPVFPVAAGDFVDNSAVPTNSEWHCSDVD